jgi:hypothetical protein
LRGIWETVVEPVLAAVRPKVIVEIGVRHGQTTVMLLEFASKWDCQVHGIDPIPGDKLDLPALEKQYGDRFSFHHQPSLDALNDIEQMDAILIDGDHNWYTVFNELKLIAKRAADEGRPFPTLLMHDVDWPHGRRDRYANIDAIPEEYRSQADWWNHSNERIPRVGVRTAIEDFLEATDLELEFRDVVGLGGVGIIVPASRLAENEELRIVLDRFNSPEWLRSTCRRIDRVRRSLIRQLTLSQRKAASLEAKLDEADRRDPSP